MVGDFMGGQKRNRDRYRRKKIAQRGRKVDVWRQQKKLRPEPPRRLQRMAPQWYADLLID